MRGGRPIFDELISGPIIGKHCFDFFVPTTVIKYRCIDT